MYVFCRQAAAAIREKYSGVNDCTRRRQVQPRPATSLTGQSAPTSNEVPQTRQTAQVHLHLRSPSARSSVIHDVHIYIYSPLLSFLQTAAFAIPLSEPRRPGLLPPPQNLHTDRKYSMLLPLLYQSLGRYNMRIYVIAMHSTLSG
jgi:hypothetical protein